MTTKAQQKPDSPNLRIWNRADSTPTAFTKETTIGGMKFTAINAMYMVRKATELFGPIGIGWGWEILEERYNEGATVYGSNNQNELGKTSTHTLLLKLWYKLDGEKGEITQYGHTEFISKTKWGLATDPEAPKKSLTDAMKKCLSLLGIAGDVYLGMFDDNDYVEALKLKEQIEESDDTEAAYKQAREDYMQWEERQIAAAKSVSPRNAVHMLPKIISDARVRCKTFNADPDQAERRIRAALDAHLNSKGEQNV